MLARVPPTLFGLMEPSAGKVAANEEDEGYDDRSFDISRGLGLYYGYVHTPRSLPF